MKILRFLLALIAVLVTVALVSLSWSNWHISYLTGAVMAVSFFLAPYFAGALLDESWVYPLSLYFKILVFWALVLVVAVPLGFGLPTF